MAISTKTSVGYFISSLDHRKYVGVPISWKEPFGDTSLNDKYYFMLPKINIHNLILVTLITIFVQQILYVLSSYRCVSIRYGYLYVWERPLTSPTGKTRHGLELAPFYRYMQIRQPTVQWIIPLDKPTSPFVQQIFRQYQEYVRKLISLQAVLPLVSFVFGSEEKSEPSFMVFIYTAHRLHMLRKKYDTINSPQVFFVFFQGSIFTGHVRYVDITATKKLVMRHLNFIKNIT